MIEFCNNRHENGVTRAASLLPTEGEVITQSDIAALESVLTFRGKSSDFRDKIAEIEEAIAGPYSGDITRSLEIFDITDDLLSGAVLVKRLSAQIDVVLHAVGILRALPDILEPGERIQSLSLGAGNTGRNFDLETDCQVAEFTFIDWKGGSESVRQDKLLIDVFHLAAADTFKRRVLYLVGPAIPVKFLRESRRNTRQALARRAGEVDRFQTIYGDQYPLVRDYWNAVKNQITVVDLRKFLPSLTDIVSAE